MHHAETAEADALHLSGYEYMIAFDHGASWKYDTSFFRQSDYNESLNGDEMTNILLNALDFDGSWAYGTLSAFLKPHMKAALLPLSYQEGWLADEEEWRTRYRKGTDDYELLVRPFRSYFMKDEDMIWINPHEDDHETALHKIEQADLLFLSGAYPDWMMQRLDDLELFEALQDFDGIIMGYHGGAMIQLDEYHLTRDEDYEFGYQNGIGLLSGFDLETKFEADEAHLEAVIRSLEEKGNPVICLPEKSGVVVSDQGYQLLGRAFTAGLENLDDLYDALEDARRNGIW
jgi:hypothetical protein